MKNSILNLGKALNKAEQKEINGGLQYNTIIKCVTSGNCNAALYGESVVACVNGRCIFPWNQ